MKKVAVLVSNDLTHDQRVRKVCEELLDQGHDITLVGRKLPTSEDMERPYEVIRLPLYFSGGALFYASLNIRFFLFLLSRKFDVVHVNDLDTLLPAFLIARFKRWHIVYDSHEYFTEAAGLTGRNFQKSVWLGVEKWIFPKLKHVVTVNESIAAIYRDKYSVPVNVVRNIPPLTTMAKKPSREDLGLPADKRIVLLQGAYIDYDRGCLEAVQSMQWVDNVLFLVIGSGQEVGLAKEECSALGLDDKVRFMPKMPFDKLRQYTSVADLGLSLDKPLHLNYKLSLPNKLFDYIHAAIPVVTSPLPELKRIVDTYNIGMTTEGYTPEAIAQTINAALDSTDRALWQANLKIAAKELTWDNEKQVFKKIYAEIEAEKA
ncbi:MAG: glycosyltransferase involved in cell wall biosynthesis [Flavobacteriales bacterium]|jgi:glycosyltransferase involved in cell wall biosynthesis